MCKEYFNFVTLGGSDVEKTAGSTSNTSSSFIPNYLANPPFPYFENKTVPVESLVSERFDAGIDSTNSSLSGALRSTGQFMFYNFF